MTDTADLLIAESPADAPRAASVGRQLHAARVAAGWSVDDVARSLKFGVRQVEALEADDFSALQGDTFVRGFVRVYARLFKLDPAPLLAALSVAVPPAMVEIAVPDNMGEADVRPFSVRYQRAIIVFLIMLVVGVIAAYVLTRGMLELAWLGERAAATSAPATEETAPTLAPAPAETALQDATPAVAPIAVPAPAPAGTTEQITAPPATAAPQAVAELAPGERRITLDFSDRSWVEIKDAKQQIILTGEFPGGTHQAVNGKPPFKLWIGRVSAVSIQYGDKKVDLAASTRDDVARLTLE